MLYGWQQWLPATFKINVIKKILLYILLFLTLATNGQRICIDSFENKSLYNERYKYLTVPAPAPLLSIDSSTFYNSGLSVIKKNNSNTIEWVKNLNKLMAAQFVNDDNDIIGSFNSPPPGSPTTGQGIMKLSSATGNIIWAKKINVSLPEFNNYGYVSTLQKGINNDIILCNAVADKMCLTILDQDATTIKLFKNYSFILPDGHQLVRAECIVVNNSIFVTAITQKYQLNPVQIHSANLFFLKINYSSGAVEKINYLHVNDEVSHTEPNGINITIDGYFSTSFVSKAISNEIVIAGRKAFAFKFDNNRFYSMKIDSNLSVIQHKIYKSLPGHSFFNQGMTNTPFITESGSILFAALQDTLDYAGTSNRCNYFTLDSNFDVTSQKQINITETGLQTGGYNLNVVPLLKWQNDVELIFHTKGSQHDSVLHIVEIPFKLKDEPCRSVDHNFLSVENPSFTQLPPPTVSIINLATVNISPYNLLLSDDNVEERKFCTNKSICDTIKINGPAKLCLPSDTSTYRVYKNPLCKRKTTWFIDTSAIRIIDSPNEDIIKVKFLRAYTGYIKAQFEGCELADSLLIEILNPEATLNLGNDTILCPGKAIVLKAGSGFKTFRWQNGSIADSFIVTQPGLYYVDVTDRCDNIFTDSIIVSSFTNSFQVNYESIICQYDSARIVLDGGFKNYSWQPAAKGIINNANLYLFPSYSTVYTVSAEAFAGCILTDTVTINTKNCPIYFYVPNAFTPNNDGTNDSFKPLLKGPVINYRFTVYNRYGNQVFTSSNPQQGWDGTFKSKKQDNAVFIWTCDYQFAGKELINQKGTVTLIR